MSEDNFREDVTTNPEVSVVIPTRDSVVQLRRCLESLSNNQGTTFEVLVVDQASCDGTRHVALAAGAAVIDAPRPDLYAPPTRSRNLGAGAARGEFLLHLDADMSVRPGLLGAAVRACRGAGYVALTLEEVDLSNGFWADCKALERRAYRGSDLLQAARFVRADVFGEVGGYDETVASGEDWDIHSRYARVGSIGRLQEAVYHHLGRFSFAAQLRKKFEYGRSALPFLGKHDASEFSAAMATAYWRSWRDLASDPVHTLGFALLRFGEVVALATGIALSELERKSSRTSTRSASDERSATDV